MSNLAAEGEFAAAVYAQASSVVDASGGDTGVSLQLPLLVGADAKTLTASDAGGQPPFAALPGLAYTYQIQVGGQPAYVYFAAVEAGSKAAGDLETEIQTAISKTFSAAIWKNVQVSTQDGSTMSVRRVSATGAQDFSGSSLDGRFDLYRVSSSSHHVLMGWRAPVVAGNSESFFEKVQISMGTVQGGSS